MILHVPGDFKSAQPRSAWGFTILPFMSSDFKKLMFARLLFRFAVEMQAMLLGWRMNELTHSPLFLGLVGLAEALPALGLAMRAGYFVDRSRPLLVSRCVAVASLLSGVVMFIS